MGTSLRGRLNASELIVIGYSFRPADSAAWVLWQAGSREWKFVDRPPGKEPLYDSFESWMSVEKILDDGKRVTFSTFTPSVR